MAVSFTTERMDDKNAAVLKINGRLDAAALGDFEAALLPLAGDAALERIVLDGTNLEYIASAGLRVLLKAIKAMGKRKAKLLGAAFNPQIVSVLKMTGFLSYIELNDNAAECLP